MVFFPWRFVGLSPCLVAVTTRVVRFLVGDPYKTSFATVTGRGDNPSDLLVYPVGDILLQQNEAPLFFFTVDMSKVRNQRQRLFFL